MRIYKIFFDTQKNRVYRNWEYGTEARNKRDMDEIEQYKQMVGLDKFHCINWKPVTWGRR